LLHIFPAFGKGIAMKPTLLLLLFLALSGVLCAEPAEKNSVSVQAVEPQFEDYPVSIYKGKVIIPGKFKKDKEGIWRDEFGKGMGDPQINFAGKYFLSEHSCGFECRYYELTDLTSGRSVPGLNMFASGDPPNMTREGYPYLTLLSYRADSAMIVALYLIDKGVAGEYDCRERVFLFDEAEQIRPITRTKYNRCSP
jgi:hypothetical protein